MLIAFWKKRRPATPGAARRMAFAGPTDKPLDLLMPPPYEMVPERERQDRARVEQLVEKLKPNAVDAGSREVLFNYVNALADQSLAELEAARDERQAVGRV